MFARCAQNAPQEERLWREWKFGDSEDVSNPMPSNTDSCNKRFSVEKVPCSLAAQLGSAALTLTVCLTQASGTPAKAYSGAISATV